jgi:hypothetical protein
MHAQAFLLDDGLIQISGQDKLSYLHGQITQDVNLITPSQFKWAGHCSPKGKLWGVFRLFKFNESYVLWGSKPESEMSLRELKKYGVFAKVDISTPNLQLIGVISSDLNATAKSLGITIKHEENCYFSATLNAQVLVLDSHRLVLVSEAPVTLPEAITLQPSTFAWTQASILAAEPRLNEQSDEYVPQMVNLQAIGGISFKKGCYTGQETVARMRYLGKNKRAMYIAKANLSALPESLDLEIQVESGWRRANSPLHYAFDTETQQFSALLVLPNDTELDAVLRFKEQPESLVSLQALPYSLDDPQ